MKKKFKVGSDNFNLGLGVKPGDIIEVEDNIILTINGKPSNSAIKWSFPKRPFRGKYSDWQELLSEEEIKVGDVLYVKEDASGIKGWMLGRISSLEKFSGGIEKGIADFIHKFEPANHGIFVNFVKNNTWCFSSPPTRTYRRATEEEIQWLDACITANKYMEKEEALKKNIPEYVECVKTFFAEAGQVGKIFKTSSPFPNFKFCENLTWVGVLEANPEYFKPSTKEAYEAQSSPRIEYYKCIKAGAGFTEGKIYKINGGKQLEDSFAFTNDHGKPDGWAGGNKNHFTPSTEADFLSQSYLKWKISLYANDDNGNFKHNEIPKIIHSIEKVRAKIIPVKAI